MNQKFLPIYFLFLLIKHQNIRKIIIIGSDFWLTLYMPHHHHHLLGFIKKKMQLLFGQHDNKHRVLTLVSHDAVLEQTKERKKNQGAKDGASAGGVGETTEKRRKNAEREREESRKFAWNRASKKKERESLETCGEARGSI